MSSPSPHIVDPGLQPERTDHSWRRTGFSFLAVGGLMLHMADGMSHVLGLLFAIPVIFFAIWVHRYGPTRYRLTVTAVRRDGIHGRVMNPGPLRIITAVVITMQVLAILLAVNAVLHQH